MSTSTAKHIVNNFRYFLLEVRRRVKNFLHSTNQLFWGKNIFTTGCNSWREGISLTQITPYECGRRLRWDQNYCLWIKESFRMSHLLMKGKTRSWPKLLNGRCELKTYQSRIWMNPSQPVSSVMRIIIPSLLKVDSIDRQIKGQKWIIFSVCLATLSDSIKLSWQILFQWTQFMTLCCASAFKV